MRKRIAAIVASVCIFSFAVTAGNVILAGRIHRTVGNEFGGSYQYSGSIHFHTRYSDGSGTYGEVAETAASLGIDFIIPSDHNTVQPMLDGWAKYSGDVLVIPAVEHSMDGGSGHFLSIGDLVPPVRSSSMPALEVYHTCADSNMLMFPAHVYHPRHNSWQHWDEGRYTGFELFNLDENWRLNLRPFAVHRLLAALCMSPFRDDVLNYLLVYPARECATFDTIAARRHVVGIGSTDAHARIRIFKGDREKGREDTILAFPRYDVQFALVQTIIETEEPFSGNYESDRGMVIEALRRGHCYIGFSGLENARGFRFRASNGSGQAAMGDSLFFSGSATLSVSLPDSGNVEVRILRNGDIVHTARNTGFVTQTVTRPGVYRVEVYQRRLTLPFFVRKPYPWIISNPVYCVTG